jgi:oxygen-dependent protoporphyrinogen oxidase
MSLEECDVLVIGAGAAGLAAARSLESAGREVLVVEAGAQPGGVMQTSEVDGYRVEHGPNSLQVKPGAHRFFRDHGLMPILEKAAPASRKRQLFAGGALVDVPMGPVALLRTKLLSGAGKRRLLAEPFVKRGDGSSETVAEFIARRLGPEAVSALVGPFLTGVYAGDEEQLGADPVFPALVEFERSHGSMVLGGLAGAVAGFRKGRAEAPAPSGPHSAKGGLGTLARELASGLASLRLEAPVHSLVRDGESWRACFGHGDVLASAVVLATPAREAAALLESVSPEAAEGLAGIEYAPIAALALGADPQDLRSPAEGFGFLVPRDAQMGLLGCLFMSQLFAGRAPEGKLLLHCMVGGVRWPEAIELADDELTKRVFEDLDRSLGLRSEPQRLVVRRWPRAVAQPRVDHRDRIQKIRTLLGEHPRLEAAGSYLDGVSLADTLASGVAAAERLQSR